MAACFVVSGLGCIFDLMLEFLIAPRRLALCVVNLEPGEGFGFAQGPAVVEGAGDRKGLVVSMGSGNGGWGGLEIIGDALFGGWL